MKNILAFAVLPALVLSGCRLPPVLVEPNDIPLFVSSYKASKVHGQLNGVKCSLNLINCVSEAAVGEKTISGKTMSEQMIPIRPIVQSEFENLIKANFSPISGNEQPNVELKIETQKVLLTLDGSNYRFDYSSAIKVLNPLHEDKPYFSKIYSARTYGKCKDREFVPDCVYKAIQSTLAQFLADLNKDESLLTTIEKVSK